MTNDFAEMVHGPMWKGVTLSAVGLGATVYAGVERLVGAAADIPASLPISSVDISGSVGTVLTIAGAVWTWWLFRQGKQADFRRRQAIADADAVRDRARADAEARREIEVHDRLARVEADRVEAMARIEVMLAAQMAHLTKQDAAIADVKQAVRLSPPG